VDLAGTEEVHHGVEEVGLLLGHLEVLDEADAEEKSDAAGENQQVLVLVNQVLQDLGVGRKELS